LDVKVIGSGVGVGVGEGWVGACASGWEPVPAGAVGVPPHADRLVTNRTAPAATDSLRMLLFGINIPMFDVNTVGARPEYKCAIRG